MRLFRLLSRFQVARVYDRLIATRVHRTLAGRMGLDRRVPDYWQPNHRYIEPLEGRLLLSVALPGSEVDEDAAQQVVEQFNLSAALFVENQGQWADDTVRYLHQGNGANVAMTDTGPAFQLFRPTDNRVSTDRLQIAGAEAPTLGEGLLYADVSQTLIVGPRLPGMRQFAVSFVGAESVTPVGLSPSSSTFNYSLGDTSRHREGVNAFEVVAYEGLYPGIDLHTWGQRNNLKYEFIVAPGSDYKNIQINYDSVKGLSVAEDGSLRIDLSDGWAAITDAAPYTYQVVDGVRVDIESRYVLADEWTYGFELGTYDPTRPLIIDPELAWSTYAGGVDSEGGIGVAVDSSGNILISGTTYSGSWTIGGIDTTYNDLNDAFVAKFSSSGQHLWSTYLGGSGGDDGSGIAVDSAGNVLVTGNTFSTGWISGGYDTSMSDGGSDAFVVKLSSSGHHLWSTYLGSTGIDSGHDIATDSVGDVLVSGSTSSSGWVSGGHDISYNGGISDAFIVKLGSFGQHLWSTYLGGSGVDDGYSIDVDESDSIFVAGHTASSGWVSGGYDTSYNNSSSFSDAFLAKLSPSGHHLWSTYIGGSSFESGFGVAVDNDGSAIVTGYTESEGWVSGGHDTSYNGDYDAFIVKVGTSGQHLWSSYLGGPSGEWGLGTAVDSDGNILVTGDTESSGWIVGSIDTSHNGDYDAFVAKLDTNGQLLWSTYLGGFDWDTGFDIAEDGSGGILVTGRTASPGWTIGGYDTVFNGDTDVFLVKIVDDVTSVSAPVISTIIPISIVSSSNFQTLTISGSHFHADATLTFDPPTGANIESNPARLSWINDSQLTYQINNGNDTGTWRVRVNNPDGQMSDWVNFEVIAVTPTITSVSPNPVTGSNSNQNLTINGSNFVSGAIVRITDLTNGGTFDKTPTSFSSNQLVISANFTTAQANWTARVINPGNAGSNTVNFTVNAPTVTPTITSVSPNSVVVSTDNTALTIVGNNFVQGATLTFVAPSGEPIDSTATKLTFVSSSQIIYQFNSQSRVGTWSVKVNNPGGQSSDPKSFQVTAATATLATPTLVSATPEPDGNKPGIRLTWTAVSSATNYKIYRNGSLIFTTATAGTTFWNISGLTAGQGYTYQVQAVSGTLVSELSNSVSATAPTPNSQPPAPDPTPGNVPELNALVEAPGFTITGHKVGGVAKSEADARSQLHLVEQYKNEFIVVGLAARGESPEFRG